MGNLIIRPRGSSRKEGSRARRRHTNSTARQRLSTDLPRAKPDGARRSSLDLTSLLKFKLQRRSTIDTQRVNLLPVPTPNFTKLHFLAIMDHSPRGYGDISLLRGESILVHGQMAESGWWYGEAVETGEVGYVPCSAVAPLETLESLE